MDWFAWNEEAFEKSRRESKPIFLSIGYSTCHWCHVMERESFEDKNIGDYLNEHFVSIKVDRERRLWIKILPTRSCNPRRAAAAAAEYFLARLSSFFGSTLFSRRTVATMAVRFCNCSSKSMLWQKRKK